VYEIHIDPSLCSGFGSCVELAPEIFALDDDGTAKVKRSESDDPAVLDAAAACPMAAISVSIRKAA
jgi:ferredoxin